MIVKLYDVRVFFPGNDNSWVDAVRKFGNILDEGIHIDHLQEPVSGSINRSRGRIDEVNKALTILDDITPCENESKSSEILQRIAKSPEMVVRNTALAKRVKDKATADIELINQSKEWYERWDENFNLRDLKKLEENGIYLKFYTADKKMLKSIPEDKSVRTIALENNKYQVILITRDANDKLEELEEDPTPDKPLSYINDYIVRKQRQLKEAEDALSILATETDTLRDYLIEHEDFLLERMACRGMELIEGKVPYMKCYVPEKQLADVKAIAEEYSLGTSIMEVEDDDSKAPTLLKNPKWVDRIKPVMNFMGLVHGYHELDVSRIFMIFFTFFTGILVGDAGYGLVFLIITLLVHSKLKFKGGIEFALIYTLCASVMFWGAITGTYFGVPELAKIPGLSNLVIDKMASFGGDSVFIQKVMFLIGAVHLTIGHLQTAWKYINSIRAIGQIGWVAIVWSLYFVVAKMVLKIEAPEFLTWLFVGGVTLVALFSHSKGNFLKGVGSSLGNLPLSVISGFSDIISYIRLYAVGLSTVLMAQSFNTMAIGDGVSSVGAFIMAVLVLIAGHALNMTLAGMAVIVHGVRLNMLEYAGHAGVEFSGTEYIPFKFKRKDKK